MTLHKKASVQSLQPKLRSINFFIYCNVIQWTWFCSTCLVQFHFTWLTKLQLTQAYSFLWRHISSFSFQHRFTIITIRDSALDVTLIWLKPYLKIRDLSGSVHQQSLETRPAVFSTREGDENSDDSYMGYSTVVGRFQELAEYDGIAVGMPRGNNLRGKVRKWMQ